MNVSSAFAMTATTLSLLAAVGCTSTRTAPEVATAPMAVPAAPPEQTAAADTMPSHPALQNERTAEADMRSDAPVAPPMVAQEPVVTSSAADFTERAPKADRN